MRHERVSGFLAAMALLMMVPVAAAGMKADSADADGAGDLIRFDGLLGQVRSHHPDLKAARSHVKVAESARVQAGLIPNPVASYSLMGIARGANTIDGREHLVSVEQPVFLFGQRGARIRMAEHQIAAVGRQADIVEAELLADARELFIHAFIARERERVAGAAREDLLKVQSVVEGRGRLGLKSQFEVFKIRMELAAFTHRMESARIEAERQSAQLGAALGRPGWKPEARGKLRPLAVPSDFDQLWKDIVVAHPRLQAAEAELRVAEAGVELARRERWPQATLVGGVQVTTNQHSVAPFGGIGLEIPLFDRGQGTVGIAGAGRVTAELESQATMLKLQGRLAAEIGALRQRLHQLEGFDRRILDGLPELRKMAEASYREGAAGLLELLDAFRTETDLRLEHLDTLEQVLLAEVRVLSAAGLVEWVPAEH
ncbi:MAG: TolC family protein [Deltaproteobacteria bacterium]|nr:TolC family protein [Deltaproteobacteria bacterium]